MKLTEFAANMSAILSEILLLLFVSVRHINRFYSKQSILKQVFGFRNTIGNESQIKATKTVNNKLSSQNIKSSKALNNSIINVVNDKNSIEKVNNLSSSNVIMNFKNYSLKALPQNETIYKIKNLQPSKPIRSSKIQSDTFHMNLLQMLITLIVPCLQSSSLQRKSRLIKKVFIKIFTHLDIFTYINKMHQLELISYLLIDSNSNRILNILSKPVISVSPYNDIFDYIKLQSSKETTDKEMNDIYTYLNYINTKSHKTYMESKLVELSEMHLDSVYHL